ncbi:hypothetical protein LLG96_02250 [bacterium]|nr:hypothetical protein [bacterium]
MRIAIPLWYDSVSPVLDTAGKLVIMTIENGSVVSRSEISLNPAEPVKTAELIANQADVLVCGALSRQFASYLTSLGVDIYPWTMGTVDRIVDAFINGTVQKPEFTMPGCRKHRHRWCERGRQCEQGRPHRQSHSDCKKEA